MCGGDAAFCQIASTTCSHCHCQSRVKLSQSVNYAGVTDMEREKPRGSDGVDGRHEYLVELAIGRVDVLGNLVRPRDPLAALHVPEVVKQRRRAAGYLT